MNFHPATTSSRALRDVGFQRAASTLGVFAAALFASAAAHAVPQFGVTAVNANGNSLYNVILTPNPTANTGALITSTQAVNTDAATHGRYSAVVRAPNSVTSTLDLIVADTSKGQLVRYPGPGPGSYAVSTTIFSYSGKGSGPKTAGGLAVDVAGNLLVASAGDPSDKSGDSDDDPRDARPGLWILPFNTTTGVYGKPVLIDKTFGGVKARGIADVVVAGFAASRVGSAAPAWNAGDVLVLVNVCASGAKVLVYSQAAIAGVMRNPGTPLTGPTSTLITSSAFTGSKPTGIDLWPADATRGVSLLIPTADGRVLRFDSATNSLAANFASGLGQGLLKIKVGTYSTVSYAFVAQSAPGTGRILQLAAPSASGANAPLATVSTGVNNPQGLAVTSSGSVPISDCIAPNSCAPLGGQLTTQISGPGTAQLPPNAPLLQESCVVKADPRVSVAGTNWSCDGSTLDIANYCPGFPSTVLPGFLCGHSGPTGSGFVVVKSTAKTVDQNVNNTFIQVTVEPDLPLPGPLNLTCPRVPMLAWAPRSDLPLIEGTIPESRTLANTFIDLSAICGSGGGRIHVASMLSYGLGLNTAPSGLPNGLPGFVRDKFSNLTDTITDAAAQISDQATLQGYVTRAQNYFNAGVANTDAGAYACAMNTIAAADDYLQANLAGFTGAAPPGNPNPAGDVDGRLGNLFLTIGVNFLLQPPNGQWPTTNVPPCVTFSVTPATVTVGSAAQLTWANATASYPASACQLSASDGTFQTPKNVAGSGSVSTGPLTSVGTYSAQITCSGAPGTTITSFAQTTVNVISLSSIGVSPPTPQVAAGGTVQLTATGTYTDQSTKDLTASATWASSNTNVATVSAGLVTCNANASIAGTATISATGATATGTTSGYATVSCLAPVLGTIAVTPATASVAAGGTTQLTATGAYSSGPTQDLTSSAVWSSSASSVANVSAGLVSCVAGANGQATVTASVGAVTGSATVTCLSPVLQSIAVTPASPPELDPGQSLQLAATGTYSSGPAKNLTSTAQWASSAPGVATVSASGIVTCNKPPPSWFDSVAMITATVGTTTGSTKITCEGLYF